MRTVFVTLWASALVSAALCSPLACTPDSETPTCPADSAGLPGEITLAFLPDASGGAAGSNGSTGKAGSEELAIVPRSLNGTLSAPVFIESLTAGGVNVTSSDGNYRTWTVSLTANDLALNRIPGTETAKIDFLATDVCTGQAHLVGSVNLRIGPLPKTDAGLELELTLPDDQCYLPANGAGVATVTVLANRSYTNATVILAASGGMFSPATVVLADDGVHATASSYFTPPATANGPVQLTASAQGSVSDPLSVIVAAHPVFIPTSLSLGVGASLSLGAGASTMLFLSSSGVLAQCLVDVSLPTADAVCDSQSCIQFLVDDKNLADSPRLVAGNAACGGDGGSAGQGDGTGVTQVPISVIVDARAPANTQATLRCFDTFRQEADVIITVAPPAKGDGGSGGDPG